MERITQAIESWAMVPPSAPKTEAEAAVAPIGSPRRCSSGT